MTNGEAVIAKLISEVADLTKANVLLHGIVSNREEEISDLRAQLASASERVAEMQYEAGMYHSLYDVATERLASARKGVTELAAECHRSKWQFDLSEDYRPTISVARAMIPKAFDALHRIGDAAMKLRSSLTDEKSQS